MADSNIISLRSVKRVYGKKNNKFVALKGVSLDIKRGESVAVIGKSGSGKSTLMHILALLDSPTEGKVFINGVDSTNLRQGKINKIRNRKFGFVFQEFFMNARDTVLNNVMLPLKIAGVRHAECKRRAMQALRIVEMADKAKNRATDLSGGQKQRVCIARALVNGPSVIFADEPTGNLDSVTGKKVEDILFRLNQKAGITLIVVTHDEDLAKKCDRQVYIKDGRISE